VFSVCTLGYFANVLSDFEIPPGYAVACCINLDSHVWDLVL